MSPDPNADPGHLRGGQTPRVKYFSYDAICGQIKTVFLLQMNVDAADVAGHDIAVGHVTASDDAVAANVSSGVGRAETTVGRAERTQTDRASRVSTRYAWRKRSWMSDTTRRRKVKRHRRTTVKVKVKETPRWTTFKLLLRLLQNEALRLNLQTR